MKILFAYRGRPGLAVDDIPNLPTAHMSAVNDVLVRQAWEEMGHHVEVYETGKAYDPASWDMLYLWKVHSIIGPVLRDGILSRAWPRVAGWMDFNGTARTLGPGADLFESVAWGTQRLLEAEGRAMPGAKHFVVEHATTFSEPPPIGKTRPRGLYAGRLPAAYRDQVALAAKDAPFDIYALKLWRDGRWVLLRPGQYGPEQLAEAAAWCPDGCTLLPAVNFQDPLVAREVSCAAFGLVPSTKFGAMDQSQSACKAWDYWSMGLPVVMADNVPEAHWVRGNPGLGYLYRQDFGPSLGDAIGRALDDAERANFMETRRAIQRWTFESHTWSHRAEEIADAQF